LKLVWKYHIEYLFHAKLLKLSKQYYTFFGIMSTIPTTYEEIMGLSDFENNSITSAVAIKALSQRLQTFRHWLTEEAHAEIHPAICLVNGEATDGTKNAPVLILERYLPRESAITAISVSSVSGGGSSSSIHSNAGVSSFDNMNASTTNGTADNINSNIKKSSSTLGEGRVGTIDNDVAITALYDRTMGCQVRTVREMKPNDVMMILPRSSMITPDLIASSDAGKAVFACCKSSSTANSLWDLLENTTICERKYIDKIRSKSGAQPLVKILHERKRAEAVYGERMKQQQQQIESAIINDDVIRLAEPGTISTRAPFLLFIIHQRFFPSIHVPVSSSSFIDTMRNNLDNVALTTLDASAPTMQIPPESPTTYAPYARTLPSSVSIPLCWKRSELAMISGCIPGLSLLQDVGVSTMHLVSEYVTLLEAGILERFPNTFPPGLITWDRYVWAAAIFSSRNLPSTSYYNVGDMNGSSFQPNHPLEFQSPPDVWDEVGVLIPLLDMLNHEIEDHQVTWEQCRHISDNMDVSESNRNSDIDSIVASHPKAIIHKKVKKGSEVYCCYGPSLSNTNLILQYGFAQINNLSDEVQLGWAISDAVGNVHPPFDFIPPYPSHVHDVYESNDERAINAWWTNDRLSLLEVEACSSDSAIVSDLKLGKKMAVMAYADGRLNPILLTAVVVATMPEKDLHTFLSTNSSDADDNKNTSRRTIIISKRHQKIIQQYLQFSFIRKLEKLLQNLNNGLSGFFSNLKLWTKSSEGGLHYESKGGDIGSNGYFIGWQSFFDLHAYKGTMKVESRYYAMGTASCVLTLCDGQLRALQTSLDIVTDLEKFTSLVLKQLEELGYEVSNDVDDDEVMEVVQRETTDNEDVEDIQTEPKMDEIPNGTSNGVGRKSPRNRRRNRRRNNNNNRSSSNTTTNERKPALKLHVGNLSYTTTPADLYDYFSSIYGQDKVLECHIPTERETGKSRGFGFVAMPETIAENILKSGRKHEIDGRILKVARSSSAGAVSTTKVSNVPPPINNERCLTCGYRPKYCICSHPNVGSMNKSAIPNVRISFTSNRVDPILDREFGSSDYYRDNEYRHRDQWDDGGRYRDYDHDRRYRHHYDDEYRRGQKSDIDHHYGEGSHRDQGLALSPRDYRDRDHSPHGTGTRSRSSSRRWEHHDRHRPSHGQSNDNYNEDGDEESNNSGRGRKRSRSKDKNRRKKSKIQHRSRSPGSSASSI
jgi:RNA recognition motif-containing protein